MQVAVWILATVIVFGLFLAAIAVVAGQQRAAALPDAFRCKLALASKDDRVAYQWPRHVSHAVWVHDVLIVLDGLSRTRIRPLAVHFAEGSVATMMRPVSGLGPRPVVMALETDDGRQALLAAPRSSGALVAGPFLAALLSTDDVPASTDRSGD